MNMTWHMKGHNGDTRVGDKALKHELATRRTHRGDQMVGDFAGEQ